MILMHKNNPACEIVVVSNQIVGIKSVLNKHEMPVGIYKENKLQMDMLISAWAKARTVPTGRKNIEELTKKLGFSVREGFFKARGMSLTDTYWLKNDGEDITWEDVNFHDNGFDTTFGSIYTGTEIVGYKSPDFTTDGYMEKFWASGAAPCLVKLGKEKARIVCANEVVASYIAAELGINHVSYEQAMVGEIPACICPCFVEDSDTDFVTANQLSKISYSSQAKLIELFKKWGLSKELADMIFLDTLLGNQDRHDRNFGVLIQNGQVSFAPLFDSGACLSYSGIPCKELKIPNSLRTEIPGEYLAGRDVDKGLLHSVLEEVYDRFEIEEEQLAKATAELDTGIHIVRSTRNKMVSVEMEKEL